MIPRLTPRRPVYNAQPDAVGWGFDETERCSCPQQSLHLPARGEGLNYDESIPRKFSASRSNATIGDRSPVSVSASASAQSCPPPQRVLAVSNVDNIPAPLSVMSQTIKSPVPDLNTRISGRDSFSLTPPARGPTPLMMSAKRHGKDVRREHSKRRRCRSRRSPEDAKKGFCLWKDNGLESNSDESSASYDSDGTQDSQQDSPFFRDVAALSPEERPFKYWEWCYGRDESVEINWNSWSANRVAPTKGCLADSSVVPSKTIETNFTTPLKNGSERKAKIVRFGLPKAAEYEIDGPSGMLTPLPSDMARKRYSMDQKVFSVIEEESTQETKNNSAMLAEWEGMFEEPKSNGSRQRKGRRSSTKFTPTPSLSGNGLLDQVSSPQDKSREPPNVSPSMIVMNDLASLHMSTPPLSQRSEVSPMKLDLFDSQEEITNSKVIRESSAIASPDGSLPLAENLDTPDPDLSTNGDTIDMMICLKSINGEGGALDPISPLPPERTAHQFIAALPGRPSPIEPKPGTADPQNLVTALDFSDGATPQAGKSNPGKCLVVSRSEMGHALKRCDFVDQGQTIDTVFMKSLSSAGAEADDSILKAFECNDIALKLLRGPDMDHEWEYRDLLRNFDYHGVRRAELEEILTQLARFDSSPLDLLEQFLDDLNEDTRVPCNDTGCSHTIDHGIHELVMKEWQVAEEKFLQQSNEAICEKEITGSDVERIDALVLGRHVGPLSAYDHGECDVVEVERRLCALESEMRFALAVHAPSALIHCQTLCQICDFSLQEFSFETLRVSFDHPVEGLASSFSFDRKDGSFVAVGDKIQTYQSWTAIKRVQFASKFYQFFLENLTRGEFFPLYDIGVHFYETFPTISLWLGRLDVAALDFKAGIEGCRRVVVTMPSVIFYLNRDVRLSAEYNPTHVQANPFAPTKVRVFQRESEVMDLRCKFEGSLPEFLSAVENEFAGRDVPKS